MRVLLAVAFIQSLIGACFLSGIASYRFGPAWLFEDRELTIMAPKQIPVTFNYEQTEEGFGQKNDG